MPPRAIWTGAIRFGLVNVPARVYSAVHEHRLRFHLLHAADDGPIGYQKVCKLEDRPVENDEIVRAFEIEKDTFVPVTDEDFEAVQVEGEHAMELEDFVTYEEIDPAFFAHTYLVGPQAGAEKTYALLVRALADSSLAGIGRFVMRGRQYLGCLRVRDGILTLEQMHFADEVDRPDSILPDELPDVSDRELELAAALIDRFSGSWEPGKYRDTYTEALRERIEAKAAGRTIARPPEPEPEEAPDLMEALRASIEQAGGRTRRPATPAADEPTKRELEELARELDIPGRSKMTKEELAAAIDEAR